LCLKTGKKFVGQKGRVNGGIGTLLSFASTIEQATAMREVEKATNIFLII
jgi:hypothetical protein